MEIFRESATANKVELLVGGIACICCGELFCTNWFSGRLKSNQCNSITNLYHYDGLVVQNIFFSIIGL